MIKMSIHATKIFQSIRELQYFTTESKNWRQFDCLCCFSVVKKLKNTFKSRGLTIKTAIFHSGELYLECAGLFFSFKYFWNAS